MSVEQYVYGAKIPGDVDVRATPKIIHFIYLTEQNDCDIPFIYYLAIKSARKVNPDYDVVLHTNSVFSGKLLELIGTFARLEQVVAPDSVFGIQIHRIEHKIDVLRIQILLTSGRIYLDLDTICIKSFNALLCDKVVMGKECDVGLCNAVIISPPNSEFLQLWYDGYRNFHNEQWNEFSVMLPFSLAQENPTLIHLEPKETFFCPDYSEQGLRDLFLNLREFPEAYIYHLWGTKAKNYIEKIDCIFILHNDNTYNLVARSLIEQSELCLEQDSSIQSSTFEEIYKKNIWGFGSGNGSSPATTIAYRNFLEHFINLNDIKSVLDVGCGDWQFSKYIDFGSATYVGVDVVEFLISENQKRFGSELVQFKVAPVDPRELPHAELLIMKDVLQHLTDKQILFYRDNVFPRYSLCLITNSWKATSYDRNVDVRTGEFRALDLRAQPYSFKGSYVVEIWNEWERIRTMLIQN